MPHNTTQLKTQNCVLCQYDNPYWSVKNDELNKENNNNDLKSSGETFVVNESIKVPTCASQQFIQDNLEAKNEAPQETVETIKLKIELENAKTEISKLQNRIKLMDTELQFYKIECSKLKDQNKQLLDEKEEANNDVIKSIGSTKKSVTFNQNSLTPEIIDSRLPVTTPIRKGRKPENPKENDAKEAVATTPVRNNNSKPGIKKKEKSEFFDLFNSVIKFINKGKNIVVIACS